MTYQYFDGFLRLDLLECFKLCIASKISRHSFLVHRTVYLSHIDLPLFLDAKRREMEPLEIIFKDDPPDTKSQYSYIRALDIYFAHKAFNDQSIWL